MRNHTLTQKGYLNQARPQAVIWIDPKRVTHYSLSKWPVAKQRLKWGYSRFPKPLVDLFRAPLKEREPYFTPATSAHETSPLETNAKYQRIADFIDNQQTPEASKWYKMLMENIQQSGQAFHKDIQMRSKSDVDAFFANYVQPLIDSLAKKGFDPSFTGFESKAVIGPDGQLIKSGSGNHRFYLSRCLSVPSFPLTIVGMDERFFSKYGVPTQATPEDILPLLKKVEANYC